jgi:6-phosphogluconolactonase
LDPSGRYALAANFIGGSWSVLPILSSGGLGPVSSVFAVAGHGPNTARQATPHAHQTTFDPAGTYVFGNDLGTDHVWSWELDSTGGTLVPNAKLEYAQVASGSGPRHLAFHPGGKFVYAVSEMASSITAFSYDATQGTCSWLQTVSAIPADFTGLTASAEIAVHPSGTSLYASNRGHNSIVSFHIDQTTGALDLMGWTSTEGWLPRSFGIDPSGAMMLVGNQSSDTVVPFRISRTTGALTPTGAVTRTPVPVSFAFGRTTD